MSRSRAMCIGWTRRHSRKTASLAAKLFILQNTVGRDSPVQSTEHMGGKKKPNAMCGCPILHTPPILLPSVILLVYYSRYTLLNYLSGIQALSGVR